MTGARDCSPSHVVQFVSLDDLKIVVVDTVAQLVIPPAVNMDNDLLQMSREQLIAEVQRLRAGIREHRDSTSHELCWHHPALWGLLPELTDPMPAVPDWPQFLRGCILYRQSLDLQAPEAPRTSEEATGNRG